MLGWTLFAIDRALLVSESVHRENCPLRWADLSWKVPPANHRSFVVTPTREVSLVIVIVRCDAAILKHAAEIPAHRSLWYSSKLTISECRRLSFKLMAESMARAARIDFPVQVDVSLRLSSGSPHTGPLPVGAAGPGARLLRSSVREVEGR
jgi:hypothetical protein